MGITKTVYAFIEAEGDEPKCEWHTDVDQDIHDYFSAHIDKLLSKANAGSIDVARFTTGNGSNPRARFTALLEGSDAEFETAAQELANRLFAKTDKRMKRGYFVAVRREPDAADDGAAQGGAVAAVLKLDASKLPAAAIGANDIQAVKDLLDVPGSLRKGAVYPDPRTKESDVAVVDDYDALYFLQTLEAQRFLKGKKAVKQFVAIVTDVAPEAAPQVIKTLGKRKKSGAATTVLNSVPGITKDQKTLVAAKFDGPIAVAEVDPVTHPTIARIVADNITIEGPSTEVDEQVDWDPHNGGWRITIDTADKPTRTDS